MLRFGIIGMGKMGKVRYTALNKLSNCVVRMVCDPNIGQLDSTQFEGVELLESPYDVITSDQVDAVVIAVPNVFTKPLILKALENGKHVFAEKPPAMNLNEVLEIKEMTLNYPNLKLMYGFNHRHHDSIIEAKKRVDSGDYGDLLWMRGRYGKSVPDKFYSDWRSQKELAGGGIFLDQGIHMLDLFMYFAGKFDRIHAMVSNLYWKGDVEDNVFAIMSNKKGQQASLHSTMTQWRHLFSLELFLSKGCLTINGLKTGSNSYGKEILNIVKNSSNGPAVLWNDGEHITYDVDNSWETELNLFIEAVLNNTPILECGIDDAIPLMEMVDEIYSSERIAASMHIGQ